MPSASHRSSRTGFSSTVMRTLRRNSTFIIILLAAVLLLLSNVERARPLNSAERSNAARGSRDAVRRTRTEAPPDDDVLPSPPRQADGADSTKKGRGAFDSGGDSGHDSPPTHPRDQRQVRRRTIRHANDDELADTVPALQRFVYSLTSDRLLLWSQVECGDPVPEPDSTAGAALHDQFRRAAANAASDRGGGDGLRDISAWELCRFAELHARQAIAGLELGGVREYAPESRLRDSFRLPTVARGPLDSLDTSSALRGDLATVPLMAPGVTHSPAAASAAEQWELRVNDVRTAPLGRPRVRRITPLEHARDCVAVETELFRTYRWARRRGRDTGSVEEGTLGFEPMYPVVCEDEIEIIYPMSFAIPQATAAIRDVWRSSSIEGLRAARAGGSADDQQESDQAIFAQTTDTERADAKLRSRSLRNDPWKKTLYPPWETIGSGDPDQSQRQRMHAFTALGKVHDFTETYPRERPSSKKVAAQDELKHRYKFDASLAGEERFAKHMQRSLFGLTKKRGGWDALRHYELLAAGTIPYFYDLFFTPRHTATTLPKAALGRILSLAPSEATSVSFGDSCAAETSVFGSVTASDGSRGSASTAGTFGQVLAGMGFARLDAAAVPAAAASHNAGRVANSCAAHADWAKKFRAARDAAWHTVIADGRASAVVAGAHRLATRSLQPPATKVAWRPAEADTGDHDEADVRTPARVSNARDTQGEREAQDMDFLASLTRASIDDRRVVPMAEHVMALGAGTGSVQPLVLLRPTDGNQRDEWLQHAETMMREYIKTHGSPEEEAAAGAAVAANADAAEDAAKQHQQGGKGKRGAKKSVSSTGRVPEERYLRERHRVLAERALAEERGVHSTDFAVFRRGKFRFLKNGVLDRQQAASDFAKRGHDPGRVAEQSRTAGFDTEQYMKLHGEFSKYTRRYLSTESMARALVRVIVRERNTHLLLTKRMVRRVVHGRWPDGERLARASPADESQLRLNMPDMAAIPIPPEPTLNTPPPPSTAGGSSGDEDRDRDDGVLSSGGMGSERTTPPEAAVIMSTEHLPAVKLRGTLLGEIPAAFADGAREDPRDARLTVDGSTAFAMKSACALKRASLGPLDQLPRSGGPTPSASAVCSPVFQTLDDHRDAVASVEEYEDEMATNAAPQRPRPLRLLVITPFVGANMDYQQASLVNGLAALRARLRRTVRHAQRAAARNSPLRPVKSETDGDSDRDDSELEDRRQANRAVEHYADQHRTLHAAFPGGEGWLADLLVADGAPDLTHRSNQRRVENVASGPSSTAPKNVRDRSPREAPVSPEVAAVSEKDYLKTDLRIGGFPGGLDAVVFPSPNLEQRRQAPDVLRRGRAGSAVEALHRSFGAALGQLSARGVQALTSTVALATSRRPQHRKAGRTADAANDTAVPRPPWRRITDEADADVLEQLIDAVEAELRRAVDAQRAEAFDNVHGLGYTFGFRTPRLRAYSGDAALSDWDHGDRLGEVVDGAAKRRERRSRRRAGLPSDDDDDGLGGDAGFAFAAVGSLGGMSVADEKLVAAGHATRGQIDELRKLIEQRHFDAVLYAGVDLAAAATAGKKVRASWRPSGQDGTPEPTRRTMAPPQTLPPLDDGGIPAPTKRPTKSRKQTTTTAAPETTAASYVSHGDQRLGSFGTNDVEQQLRFERESAIFDAQVEAAFPLVQSVRTAYARREVFVVDGNDDRPEAFPGAYVPHGAPQWAHAHEFVTKVGRSFATLFKRELHERRDEVDVLAEELAAVTESSVA